MTSGPIRGGPSKPRSRAASRVRSPTKSKGKRRRASGRGQSGVADNNSKARALVAMTPSITPAGHIAPVGTISTTGDSTASCPSRRESCRRSLRSVESACEQDQHVSSIPWQTIESGLGAIAAFARERTLRGQISHKRECTLQDGLQATGTVVTRRQGEKDRPARGSIVEAAQLDEF